MKDTSGTIEALQASIQRRLSGIERIRIAVEMSLVARELSGVRLRREHPDWSEDQLKRELIRYAFLPDPFPPGRP